MRLLAYLFVIVIAFVSALRAEQAIDTVERDSEARELRSCLHIADRNVKLTQVTSLSSQIAAVIASAETPPDSRTTNKLQELVQRSDNLQSGFVLPPECKDRLFDD